MNTDGSIRWGIVSTTILGLILILLLSVGSAFGCAAFNRYQKRADARNGVKVNNTRIQYYQQQEGIERKKAEIRVIHAIGIRKAQDEIAATLTPLYVQFEMVQALQSIATSGSNNSVVYIPAGANGVPLVSVAGTQTLGQRVGSGK
jgi:hypothetical protein